MTEPIEQIIGDGFFAVFGSNEIIALILLGFFTAFVMLQDTRFDVKVLILTPALLLSMVYISWMVVPVVVGLAVLVYLAARKAGLF
jgi:hypothetical protein